MKTASTWCGQQSSLPSRRDVKSVSICICKFEAAELVETCTDSTKDGNGMHTNYTGGSIIG